MTLSSKPYHFALHIEGIGDDTGQKGGNLYTTEDLESNTNRTVNHNDNIPFNFTFVPGFVKPEFTSLNTKVDIFANDFSSAASTFEIRGVDDIATTLRDTAKRASFELTEDITASEPEIDTNATSAELNDTVIYVGGEAIYIKSNSHSSGGTYTDFIRGFWGTQKRPHDNGTNIFEKPPYFHGRTIRLYIYAADQRVDPTTSEAIDLRRRFKGYIRASPGQDRANIQIEAESSLRGLRGARLNKNPLSKKDFRSVSASFSAGGVSGTLTLKSDVDKSRVGSDAWKTKWRSYYQFKNKDISAIFFIDDFLRGPGSGFNPNNNNSNETLQSKPGPVDEFYELFVVSKQWDKLKVSTDPNLSSISSATAVDLTSSLRDLKPLGDQYPYHPVAVVASWILSNDQTSETDDTNFDTLHGNWSINARQVVSEGFISDCKSLIDNNPQDQIPHMVLGWDGQDVRFWETAKNLLQAFGYYFSVKYDGSLTIKKLNVTDIEFLNRAQNNNVEAVPSNTLQVKDGENEKITEVTGKVGWKPWKEQTQVTVRAVDIANTQPKFAQDTQRADVTFDFFMYDRAKKGKVVPREVMQSTVMQLAFKNPKVTFRAPDLLDIDGDSGGANPSDADNYDLGEPVALKELPLSKSWYVNNGTRTNFDPGDTDYMGVIVERTYLPESNSVNLTVLLYSEGIARWRSPSGMVKSVDSTNNEITLVDQEPLKDADSEFETGDEVQIFNKEGELVDSTVNEITGISGETLTLDGWGYGTDPSTGDIVELAFYDTNNSGSGYRNTSVGGFSNVDRVYLLLAEDDQTSGDEDLEADVYGR